MDDFLLFSRLLLAIVFLVAGITKLTDQIGTRKAITDFGMPEQLAIPLGWLIPLAELVTALALIPPTTAWWGAIGALTLLLVFTGGISINLAGGRKPDCHCFGQLHSEPIGWTTIARNAALAAVAGFVLWQGRDNAGPSIAARFGEMTSSHITLLFGGIVIIGLLVLEGWMLLHQFRQNGRLILRMDALEQALAAGGNASFVPSYPPPHQGLPMNSPAPVFELPGLDDKRLSLDWLRDEKKPVVLIFTDPGCGPCTALLPDLAKWQREYKSKLTMALVSRDTAEANRAKAEEHNLENVLLQEDREVATSYEAYGTPTAVIINPDGTIGSSLAGGSDAIAALVANAVGAPVPAPVFNGNNGNNGHHDHHGHLAAAPPAPQGAKIGEPAPQFELPDLDGKTIRLADFSGTETLLLFWNPNCGFCTSMVDDIKRWERLRPEGSPKLIVVSTGEVEANRAHEFESTVVLDQGFNVAPLYGGGGTPSAILVSADGKVASELGVGAQAVLALAGAEQVETIAMT